MKLKTIALRAMALLLALLALPGGQTATFAETEEPDMGQVTADKVNMREAPNTDSEILGEVPGGTAVEVLGKDGTWYRVLYNETVGYIRQDYLYVNSTGIRGA